MPERARIVLGGTFDRLHLGHKALLSTALHVGGPVAIGLTTDSYLARHPKPGAGAIRPYSARRRALATWLRREFPGRRWSVVPLRDRFGRSIVPEVRVLVASVETRRGAERVSRERRKLGLPPLKVILVPLVLADDLEPVTSTRIRAGVIDRNGRRRRGIHIGIRGTDAETVRLLQGACRRAFASAQFDAQVLSARSSRDPARVARRASQEALSKNDLGFGVDAEAGAHRVLVISERSRRVELYPRRFERSATRSVAALYHALWPTSARPATARPPAKG